jgi:hypothetical protein
VNGGGGKDDDADDAGMTTRAAVAAAGPVIVYEHTPRVIHARPDEFKALVQRLTGRRQQHPAVQPAAAETATSSSSSPDEEEATTVDPLLVLTLGKQAPPLHHGRTPLQLPSSPGGGPPLPADAAGFLFSPGSFLFSPATLQAVQELISS